MRIFIGMISVVLFAAMILCTGCTASVGSFYSLDEAYENGWLTQNDLQNIAYYYHIRYGGREHIDESFVPDRKAPETLSNATQNKIKRTYLNKVAEVPDGSLERVEIWQYYGSYNGCVVVAVRSDYLLIDPLPYVDHTIGEVVFYDYSPSEIEIWREDAK